ncbi:MAG: hypothetical protein U9N85_13700 [Bacteroidota bacterium]|nr:hypothetical protein [Bacteroidota bacterium]
MKHIYLIVLIAVLAVIGCNNKNISSEKSTNKIEIESQEVKPAPKHLNFRFSVEEFCDADFQDSVYYYMGKYGKCKAFHGIVKPKGDRLLISYKVIDDCCLKFRGKAVGDSAKLNLYHLNRSSEVCECNCLYRFDFVLSRVSDIPTKIFVNKEPVDFVREGE